MKIKFICIIILLSSFDLLSQGVAINNDGTPAHSFAMLDVKSTTGGVLIPRMTQAQRDAISSPANGLLIYQTDQTAGFYYYNGTEWKWLFSGEVPTVPGNVEHWVRPISANYIHPEHNANIRVHDADQQYGLYYDGNTNQYGVFSQTSSAANPTSAIVGFSNVSGNSTYGYLGYNGTYTAPTSGFGSVYGSGVYGVVDDPGRTAGFFRSTGSAEYAANIAYSDVWIPGFFYADHIDATYSGRPAIYASNNTFIDVAGNHPAVWGRSEYKAGTTSNLGYTIGGLFMGIGNTQDSYGVFSIASTTGSAKSVGVYGESSDNRNGSDHYSNNIGAIEGNGAWGTTTYNFGVVGRVAGTGRRQGGVLGTWYTTDFGALGYNNSANQQFGLLVVGGNTTTAKSTGIKTSVGMGGYGDLMGGWIRGNLYGLAIKGERYGLYVDGNHYTNGIVANLSNSSSGQRNVAYMNTSTDLTISTTGQFVLDAKEKIINFTQQFSEQVSNEKPIIVTLTPVGGFVNYYIEYVNATEFKIVTDLKEMVNIPESKNKEIKFNWIAVGTRKGYENPEIPEELLFNEYDVYLEGFMHNEADTETDALPMWWDGRRINFSPIPESAIQKKTLEKFGFDKNGIKTSSFELSTKKKQIDKIEIK